MKENKDIGKFTEKITSINMRFGESFTQSMLIESKLLYETRTSENDNT